MLKKIEEDTEKSYSQPKMLKNILVELFFLMKLPVNLQKMEKDLSIYLMKKEWLLELKLIKDYKLSLEPKMKLGLLEWDLWPKEPPSITRWDLDFANGEMF